MMETIGRNIDRVHLTEDENQFLQNRIKSCKRARLNHALGIIFCCEPTSTVLVVDTMTRI